MAVNSSTVISSMIWKLLERISSQLVSFIVSVILARILLPSDFGIIAIILVFISFANVIVDGGLNTALIQKKDASQVDFSTIFWFCLLIALLLYVLLFLGAPLIASIYNNNTLIPVLRVLGIGLFFNSFNSIQRAYVSRHMLFKSLFFVNALTNLLSGLLGVLLAYRGFGVWALVAQTLSNSLFCCFLMLFTIRWRPSLTFSKYSFFGLFDYGWKIFITNIIISIYENVRSLVIGRLYEPSILAYFDRGKTMSSLVMSNVTASIDTVLLPAFSEEQDNSLKIKQMIRRSIQVSYLFVSPLLVGLFVLSHSIIVLLLTDKWLPAVPFLRIFCVAYLLMPIQTINATCIKSLGYSNLTLKLEIIKKVLETITLIISFMINVYAVAWGIVVYNLISIIINLYPCRRLIDYGAWQQIKDIIPTIVCALIMGGIVYLVGSLSINNLLLLIIQIITGGLVYFLMCHLLRLDSLEYIFNYINGLRRRS